MLFDIFKNADINAEVETCKNTKGAVLLDVRDRDEYASGHIPGSVNVPVGEIETVVSVIPDRKSPVFAYCLSGARSGRAVRKMQSMGYTSVKSIGGISAYKGQLEK